MFSRRINWHAVGSMAPLTPHIRSHLRNVYLLLAATTVAAAAGASVHLFTNLLQVSVLGVETMCDCSRRKPIEQRFDFRTATSALCVHATCPALPYAHACHCPLRRCSPDRSLSSELFVFSFLFFVCVNFWFIRIAFDTIIHNDVSTHPNSASQAT